LTAQAAVRVDIPSNRLDDCSGSAPIENQESPWAMNCRLKSDSGAGLSGCSASSGVKTVITGMAGSSPAYFTGMTVPRSTGTAVTLFCGEPSMTRSE